MYKSTINNVDYNYFYLEVFLKEPMDVSNVTLFLGRESVLIMKNISKTQKFGCLRMVNYLDHHVSLVLRTLL